MDRGFVHLEFSCKGARKLAVCIPLPDIFHLLIGKDPQFSTGERVVVVPERDEPKVFQAAVFDVPVDVVDLEIEIDGKVVHGFAGSGDVDGPMLGDAYVIPLIPAWSGEIGRASCRERV